MDRADHLFDVNTPMLILQGTRDNLADIQLLQRVEGGLVGRADFYYVDTADHMFKVLKKAGRSQDEIMEELSAVIASWAKNLPNRK